MQRKARGFTLIELLVVIGIVGLLATFAITQLSSARDKARIASGLSFSSQMLHAAGDEAVLIWNFDDCSGATAFDSSGYGSNGTLINTTAWSTDTPNGQGCSLRMDGSVNQGVAASNVSTRIVSNTFSVSVWAKDANSTWSGNSWILSSTQGSSNNGFMILPGMNSKNLTLYLGSGGSVWAAGATVSDTSVWHQFGITYDGSVFRTYVDGKVNSKQTINATLDFSTINTFNVGGNYKGADWGVNYHGNGWVDNAQLFNKALTAQDMETLYAEGTSKRNLAENK